MSKEPIRQDELPPETETPPEAEDDTQGHTFIEEYGRTVARDRNVDAERHAREARLRDQARNKGR